MWCRLVARAEVAPKILCACRGFIQITGRRAVCTAGVEGVLLEECTEP